MACSAAAPSRSAPPTVPRIDGAGRALPGGDRVGEGAAEKPLHREVGPPVLERAPRMHKGDVRRANAGEGRCLVLESRDGRGVGAMAHLEGHARSVGRRRFPNRSEASGSEKTRDSRNPGWTGHARAPCRARIFERCRHLSHSRGCEAAVPGTPTRGSESPVARRATHHRLGPILPRTSAPTHDYTSLPFWPTR